MLKIRNTSFISSSKFKSEVIIVVEMKNGFIFNAEGDVGAKKTYYFVYSVDLVYQELGESDRKG